MSRSGSKREFSERIKKLQHLLATEGVDGALIVHKVDLYYLSGTDQDAHLFVPVEGPPVLMVRKSLVRARKDSLLENVVPLPGFSKIPELIHKNAAGSPRRIGLEMDILPALFYQKFQNVFPETEFVDISALIRSIRMIKSTLELSHVERAAAMADALLERIPEFIRDAKTEMELALKAEAFYRSKGHPGFIRTRVFNRECYYGHIMSGKGAATASNAPGPTGGMGPGPYCSQGPGNNIIQKNESILVDYAANVEGYICDQARIYCKGKLSEKFHKAHHVMLDVQNTLAEKGRPGVSAEDLYNLAIELVRKEGFIEGFMGYPDPVSFVGHGIGLEIDEWPIIGRNNKTILEEGMVVALEPKVVFPGEGVVGIENSFIVTHDGLKKLCRFPDDIVIC